MIHFQDQTALEELVSAEFSEWSAPVEVTQEMINQFAELSGDDFWIHTDPKRCAEQSPLKTTIAQGFLVLSLLSKLRVGDDVTQKISGYSQIMNYGSDKLRFMLPAPAGASIHGRMRVASADVVNASGDGKKPAKTKITMEWQINVVGQDVPCLVYMMTMVFM